MPASETTDDVVVIGAGMAGLTAARRLQLAGYRVRLLEKSRGLGGRLATRRLGGMPLDHGARFLQPQGEKLQGLVDHLEQHGMLGRWQPQVFQMNGQGRLQPAPPAAPCYVAPAGLSAVGKWLGADLTIGRQQRAIAIAPTPQATWRITTVRGDTGETVEREAAALVLAVPAPQAIPLLQPQTPTLASALQAVRYVPCITVMAQYDRGDGRLPVQTATAPWMVQGHADTDFFWLGLDGSKRNPAAVNVVIHSSAAFAHTHLEADHLQPVGETLLRQAGEHLAPWLSQPLRWQVHRWRYAQVQTPATTTPRFTTAPLPLAVCGDWCGDRQVDSALESGWQATEAINQALSARSLPSFEQWLT